MEDLELVSREKDTLARQKQQAEEKYSHAATTARQQKVAVLCRGRAVGRREGEKERRLTCCLSRQHPLSWHDTSCVFLFLFLFLSPRKSLMPVAMNNRKNSSILRLVSE